MNYFTQNTPAKGSTDFTFEYQNKQWHFKNANNLSLFKANPKKYASQDVGHCAWRMGMDGESVYGDPTLWTIVDSKIYLNYNQEVNRRWNKDIAGFFIKVNQFWLGKINLKP